MTFFELLKRADTTAKEDKTIITYKADGKIAAHAWSIATIFKESKDCLKETIDFVLPYFPEYF